MKTKSIQQQLIRGGIMALALSLAPLAQAQYDWGTWVQNTSVTLQNNHPNYGTAVLTVSGNNSPSANVPTADIYYPSMFPGDAFVAAGGVFSPINHTSGFTNTFQVDIDLTGYDTRQSDVLFGISDVASIGYGGERIYYSLQAYNSKGQLLNIDSALPGVGNAINQWWSTEDAEFTVNSTTGDLEFSNPQAGHDSQGYFFAVDPTVAHIRFAALSTTGGDGIRFYLGTPEVPEPGVTAILGLGLAGLAAFRRLRQRS
jgi:hypothetical protein